jgi:hypothetical protein
MDRISSLNPLNAGKRFIYDSITPIRLNVVGDSEECNMQFLAGGNVAVHTGLDSAPDVTVKGSLETLSNVIYQKSSRVFEEAEQKAAIVVTTHTWKGQQVMQQLRQILGSSS